MGQHYHLWASCCVAFLSWEWTAIAIAQTPSTLAQSTDLPIQLVPRDSNQSLDPGRPPIGGQGGGPRATDPPIQFVPRASPGRPPIGSQGGGTRGNCPLLKVAAKNSTLIPLVPQKIGWSATDKPTLWVYSPYLADAGVTATVVLRDVQDVSRPAPFPAIKVPLPPTPGVMQIPLPQALEPQRLYHWYFTVNCDPKDSTNNPKANGLVGWEKPSQALQQQLATATPQQQARLYAQQGFWYDALTLLAKEAPSTDWTALLKSGDPKLEAIAQEKVLR